MIRDIPDWTKAIDVAKGIVLRKDGVCPADPETFQQVAAIMGKATELLLISKNQKYGKANMLVATDYGMTVEQGLMLRENDKTERIKNSFKGVNLGKEGLLESFGDKAGYSEIGMMLQLKTKSGLSWYEVPLEE
jgi:hypothetical protein